MTTVEPPLVSVAETLRAAIDDAVQRLRRISEGETSRRPQPDAWSAKEILGHVIDSVANNHQRFVRAQQAGALTLPGYEQDAWVRVQDYQTRPWADLVELWAAYNRHLAHVIRAMSESALAVPCRIGQDEPVTLQFLVEDYLRHLRHHLAQIDDRTRVSGV